MKKLYKFYWYCGRMGSVSGLFVAEESAIEKALGKTVYFGEILGKHSDIHGELSVEDLTIMSDDPEFIAKLAEVIGSEHISGRNPLDYLEE